MTLRREMPLAWVDFLASPTDEDFDAYITFLDEVLALRTPHVTVVRFAPGSGRLSAAQVRRSSQWIKDNAEVIPQCCSGLAMVFESAALRFMLTSFLLMTKIPTAYKVCANDDEALRWATEVLGVAPLARPGGAAA